MIYENGLADRGEEVLKGILYLPASGAVLLECGTNTIVQSRQLHHLPRQFIVGFECELASLRSNAQVY